MTKELKSIFSSDFQMTEEQVSIKGVMTHVPVCTSASCHWEEQLCVCSFQTVSLQHGTDWVVVSLCWEAVCLFLTWVRCSGSGHWWLLGSLGSHASHVNNLQRVVVGSGVGPVWEGAQCIRDLFRVC